MDLRRRAPVPAGGERGRLAQHVVATASRSRSRPIDAVHRLASSDRSRRLPIDGGAGRRAGDPEFTSVAPPNEDEPTTRAGRHRPTRLARRIWHRHDVAAGTLAGRARHPAPHHLARTSYGGPSTAATRGAQRGALRGRGRRHRRRSRRPRGRPRPTRYAIAWPEATCEQSRPASTIRSDAEASTSTIELDVAAATASCSARPPLVTAASPRRLPVA